MLELGDPWGNRDTFYGDWNVLYLVLESLHSYIQLSRLLELNSFDLYILLYAKKACVVLKFVLIQKHPSDAVNELQMLLILLMQNEVLKCGPFSVSGDGSSKFVLSF